MFGPNLTSGWSFVLSVLAAIGVVWLGGGRARTYGYGREPDSVVYGRGDDRVIVEDDRPYRPLARRRRLF